MTDDANLFRRALFRRITTLVEEPAVPSTTVRRPVDKPALARAAQTLPEAVVESPPPVGEEPFQARASQRPESHRGATGPQRKQRCALVVEDDHVIRQGIAAVLDDLGWKVVETPTLDGARIVLDALRPDLVVLDFNLSGEYASVLLDELRHTRRMAPTLIVSASPLAIDTARVHGLELLLKPFGIDALIETVERVAQTAGTSG